MSARLALVLALVLLPLAAGAGSLRLAIWHLALHRDGPGLLLRDLRRGDDPRLAAIRAVIAEVAPV